MQRFYSLEQACLRLGTTETELHAMAEEGKLRRLRDGSTFLFVATEVEEMAGTVVGDEVDAEEAALAEAAEATYWHLDTEPEPVDLAALQAGEDSQLADLAALGMDADAESPEEQPRQAEQPAPGPGPVKQPQMMHTAAFVAITPGKSSRRSLWQRYWTAFRKDKLWALTLFAAVLITILAVLALAGYYLLKLF